MLNVEFNCFGFQCSDHTIQLFGKNFNADFEAPNLKEIVIYVSSRSFYRKNTPKHYALSANHQKTIFMVDVKEEQIDANSFKYTLIDIHSALIKMGQKNTWTDDISLYSYNGELDNRISCWDGEHESGAENCHPNCVYDQPKGWLSEIAKHCNVPTCYHKQKMNYNVTEQITKENSTIAQLSLVDDYEQFYYEPSKELSLTAEVINEGVVRVRLVDSNKDRYEVPIETDIKPGYAGSTDAKIVDSNVIVTRNGKTVFDTSVGPLIYEDRYLQMSSVLTSNYVYGIGETEHLAMRLNTSWYRQGIWAYDNYIEIGSNVKQEGANQWGVHPFFMNLETNSSTTKAHGVFFKNSNAMDITLQPDRVTWRTTGGVLDFYILMGPSPAEVTRQYTEVIGRSRMIPYWALGFQVCRYDYPNITEMIKVVEGVRQYGIPYDVQYGDIDYMERQLDFTVDPIRYDGLAEYVTDKIKGQYHMKFIVILDPTISANESVSTVTGNIPEGALHCYLEPNYTYSAWDKGVEHDIFIKKLDGEIDFGRQWPYLPGCRSELFICPEEATNCMDYYTDTYHAYAAYPDFFHENATRWWMDEVVKFHDELIPFDGLWIDMNEPSSFTAGFKQDCNFTDGSLNKPHFWPFMRDQLSLSSKTLCMESQQTYKDTKTDFYNTHSLFGYSQSEPTLRACEAATGKRCMVFSRSTYPGSQQYAHHWLGDNYSKWSHIKLSIIGMLEFSLFGFHYTGADICGHVGDSWRELCLRWSMLGAFYPLSRNHNANGFRRQDPAAWDDEFAFAVRDIYIERYRLLPYLYTLTYLSSIRGDTVVRPLFYEFSNDYNTYHIDEQFMWGSGLLITPAVTESNYVKSYLPPESTWFNYFTGEKVQSGYQTFFTPLDKINVHIRSGTILPLQEPDVVTTKSRVKPFGLMYALPDANRTDERGELFWDDGEQREIVNFLRINFSGDQNSIISVPDLTSYGHDLDVPKLTNVTIVGSVNPISTFVVKKGSDESVHDDFESTESGVIKVLNLSIDLRDIFSLHWY